jgi:cell division protein FtsQ
MEKSTNTLDIPVDIKFVNGLTSVLFGFFLFLVALSGVEYFLKYKVKNLDNISIKGNVIHSDISSIRNNIASNINGNFYNINLTKTKKIFESIPWVNQVVVKRVYPSQIEVKLSEYKSKAIWGAREEMKLIDEAGVVFEANTEEDEYDQMPQLIGADGQGKLMLEMYKEVSVALNPLKIKLKVLELNARGSWMATLDGGAQIELGRGSLADVIDRMRKFSTGAQQMLVKLNKNTVDIQYVDLRHAEGYAMRMHGVSTLDLTAVHASIKK